MKTHPIGAALVGLGLLAGPAVATAADACKDVRFNVTNEHFEGREIEVRSVRFRNPHDGGKVQSEDVKNLVCKHGVTCLTGGDNLGNARNVDLDDIQVVFRHRNHDGTWSKEFVTQPFTPASRKCVEGKRYGPIVVRDSH
ncbi:MAG: hypothetical protein U5L03_16440 [Burkholderiaceae bacterium]|nr:hypothetical protein [Burkholderiaceae bacterium]